MPPPKDPAKREEWIKKISGKNSPMFGRSGEKHPLYGVKRPWVSERNKTKEMREKVSASKMGEKNPMFGKTGNKCPSFGLRRTKETRELQSVLKRGIYIGINHPMYGKHHSERSCQLMADARRGRFSGENSPGWKGGISFEPYCSKFNKEFKNRVRAFFGYKCVECGRTQEENGRSLSVHHVNYNKMVCCNDVKPLFVALCHGHNAMANFNRGFWEDWYTEIIAEFYGGQCYLPQEVKNDCKKYEHTSN